MNWTIFKSRHAALLVAGLMLAGCNKDSAATQAEAEKKLADAQAQLEEAQKAVDSAKQQSEAERKVADAQAQLDQAKKNLAASQQKTTGGTASGVAANRAPAAPARPPAPKSYTLPAGSTVVVRTTSTISTKTSHSGDAFEATLHRPLEVDGVVIADRGATVRGVVTNSDPGGRVKGVASLALALRSFTLPSGQTIDLPTDHVSKAARTTKKKDAMKIGIASGVGAAIGAIAGGGKGAAIGAGAGAAGGTGMVLATHGEPATIPSESLLTFHTTAPVTVTAR